MKILFALLALTCFCVPSGGANEKPAFPRSIVVEGVRYEFNQDVLEKKLSRQLDEMNKRLENPDTKNQLKLLKVDLTFSLLAAAQYAKMTPGLKTVIEGVIADPKVANESLPEGGVLMPQNLLAGMAFEAFIDSEGNTPNILRSSLWVNSFSSLAIATYSAIEMRK